MLGSRSVDSRDGGRHTRSSPGQGADLVPVLSLFLLMLTFFLLLNSISRFDVTKTRAVLGSLDATFRSAQVTGNEREFASHAGAIVGAEALERKITELLRTAVALDRFEVIRIGSQLIVRLPLNNLFARDTADPLPGMPALLNRLTRIVGEPIPGLRNEIEVILHPAGDRTGASQSLPMARAGVLVRSLAARGIPKTGLAAGLIAGDPVTLELVFRVMPSQVRRLEFGEPFLLGDD